MLGGLFILPWLGVHYSIILAAGIYLLVALAFWLHSGVELSKLKQLTTTVVTVLVFVLIAWSIPPWDRALMVSGVFMTPDTYIEQTKGRSLAQVAGQRELLYYGEGLDGVVAVRLHQDNKALVINGKTDASSSLDLPTQILLAQLPLALDRTPESALVIGLGSGITAGTLATNESIRDLTILEISDEVVEASALFSTENYDVLNNPKVNLVTADARNFLMASSKNYDLIISEPSNPWITGISNLFTDEFFKLAKSRLNPGGVMTQWFHTYGMSNADLKTVLNTFNKNFNHVSAWSPLFEDFVIIGSNQPHAISLDHGTAAGAQIRARELSRGNVNSDRDLVMTYLFGGETLSRYVRGARINSDNHPVIEFSAPRNLYAPTTQQNMADIFEFLEGRKKPAPVVGMVRQRSDELDAGFMGLKVATNEGKSVSEVEPQWLVSQLLLENNGTKTYGVVGSERVLTWREGPARFQVRASWSPTEPTRQDLPRFLNQSNKKGLETGMINLHDDIDAIWAIRGNENQSELLLDMNWYCQAKPSGFTLFVAHISRPYVEQTAWHDALSNITNRLACDS